MSEPRTAAGKALLAGLPSRYSWDDPRFVAYVADRIRAIEDEAGMSEPPLGTRLVLVAEDLASFGTRTEDGRRITAEWGEPDAEGWYSPTFTATDDGKGIVDDADVANIEDRLEAVFNLIGPEVWATSALGDEGPAHAVSQHLWFALEDVRSLRAAAARTPGSPAALPDTEVTE